MKKLSTAAAATGVQKPISLTMGLDLGDRRSHYCVVDETGRIVAESKTASSPHAMKTVFGAMPPSRVALETSMHSPWVSRLLSGLGHE
jgi:hypothetical protein